MRGNRVDRFDANAPMSCQGDENCDLDHRYSRTLFLYLRELRCKHVYGEALSRVVMTRRCGGALLDNGILGVHPQGDALDDAESAQDERKVRGHLERVRLCEYLQLLRDLRMSSCANCCQGWCGRSKGIIIRV